MKKQIVLIVAIVIAMGLNTAISFAQRMETWEDKRFNISFQVPAGSRWTEGKEPDGTTFFEAVTPDNMLHIYIYAYKNSHVTTDELFTEAQHYFEGDIKAERGSVKSYKQGHFNVKSGDFTGTWSHGRTKERVGATIMAATDPDYPNNYVCYVTCLEKDYTDKLGVTMGKIVDSFKALK